MTLPDKPSNGLDILGTTQSLAYSEDCMRTCPQLQQKVLTALMKYAIEGGELLTHINDEIERAKAVEELPEHCELGPTQISEHDTLPGGYTPKVGGFTASIYLGQTPWGQTILGVCQIDRSRSMNSGEPDTRFMKRDYIQGE